MTTRLFKVWQDKGGLDNTYKVIIVTILITTLLYSFLDPAIEGRVIFSSSKCHKIGNIIIFLLVITIYGDILGVLQYGGALSSHYCSGFFDNRYISANATETDQVKVICDEIR